MKRILLLLIPIVIAGTSCDGVLEPKPTSDLTTDEVWSHATYGEGLLGEAYGNLNYDYGTFLSTYTENAVPATQGSNNLALGNWTVENSPIGNWETYYTSIKYINVFLENAYDLTYEVAAAEQDSLLRSHRIGEAYFLRAWYQWKLLQEYAGYAGGSSEALGYPIVTTPIEKQDNVNLERNTYEEGVEQITADLDSAIARLPLRYNGSGDIYGNSNRGRGSGLAAMALKSRVYLYAASPAYGPSSQALWERAAEAAFEAIDAAGGLTNLQPYGNFNDYGNFNHIWIQPVFGGSNFLETAYYPPSLFGNGTINPSQNLVDAFPASDGYPISQSSEYNSDNPYENRDPRFERFIFHNGEEYNGTFIETYEGGQDAPGGLSQQGTRTSYYLQKFTSYNVQLNPGNQTTDTRFKVFLSKKELYLNFAEAANEAYGPNDATLGFSAADALERIRERAGIDSDPNTSGYQDAYLDDQAASGQDAFRELVKNERRLELSFEGHHFWDTRRWDEPLTHTVEGMHITTSEGRGSQRNVALNSTATDDYSPFAESQGNVNDGYEPQNSGDTSNGVYHNWNSAGEWRYVQYDFPAYITSSGTDNVYYVSQSDIYWWSDGGGVQFPDDTYIEYWDIENQTWTEVPNPTGYGTAADQYNTTTFDEVTTNSIRVYMMNNTVSTGVIEWKVWGSPQNTLQYTYEKRDVETHTYQDYMRYAPIPYSETLIMSNLQQNSGWE